jgi:hypothetical protein
MKYIHLLFAASIALILVSLTGCVKMFNCIDGSGNLRSEYRIVAEFDGVENETEYKVKITYDSIYSLRVDADDNLLESIITSVRGNKLIIESSRGQCINSKKDILIDIHIPSLKNIVLSGSGNIDVYDFKSPQFDATIAGSGNIEIRNLITDNIGLVISGSGSITVYGKAENGNYIIAGSGTINANEVEVKKCNVTCSGSGNIYCNVINQLNVTISGSGNVIYSGSPTITKTISGSGNVSKRN